MAKFDNEWYNKGYEDGISDAQNNIDIDDILERIPELSKEECQKISTCAVRFYNYTTKLGAQIQ